MDKKIVAEELKYKDTNILEQELSILRRLLWVNHKCPPSHLYGDDGEMQCSACVLDFKRDSAKVIEHRFGEMATQNFTRALLNRKVNVKIDFVLTHDTVAKVDVATAPVLGISSQGEDRWQAEAALGDAIESVFAVLKEKDLKLKQVKRTKASKEWLENVMAQISSRCGRDRCGDIEFDGEEAEDDLRGGLKEIGVEVD